MTTAFGTVLKRLREGRNLSLREVSQLADLDHAYVHRLETGAKEAPSTDALRRLFRALKPTRRQEHVLQFLVGRDVALDLVDEAIVDDAEIAIEDFESAAQMSFRGKKPTGVDEWRNVIDKVRKLREELERG
jgi:HTH-type transcriptional regulator, competence development regulator